MTFLDAISQIKSFWEGDIPFPHGAGEERLTELQTEFGMVFHPDLQNYIRDFMPLESFSFETVGNPMQFYGAGKLGTKQYGYTFNPITGEPISDWATQWFLFADEGADPVIIDLAGPQYAVLRAAHGMGEWNFGAEADSIGQFMLCCAAMHHALTHWGPDVIVDDDNGFNLAEEPARWLFPRMKEWAGTYYAQWCSVFDNH